jgi:DNA polymerase III sliding clamp (beta) subunit (PCNA family)
LSANVEGDLVGEDGLLEFALSGRYVLDVLGALGGSVSQVQINLIDPTMPIVFRGVGDDTYTHCIMPIHIGR